jgi:hypothetical protein
VRKKVVVEVILAGIAVTIQAFRVGVLVGMALARR